MYSICIVFLLLISICHGVDISDFKTIEMPGKCFYVSELKLWPYQNNDDTINYAKQACLDLNLELAKLDNEDEVNAVHQYLRCKMSPKLKPNENVLIDVSTMYNPYLLATDEKCYFLSYYTFQTAGNETNCAEWYESESSNPVRFVCKKNAACGEIPGCIQRGGDTENCYIHLGDHMTYQETKDQCDTLGGYLPRIVSSTAERQRITDNTWVALKSDLTSVRNCKGVFGCIQTGIKYYWYGGNVFDDLPLTIDHDQYFGEMEVDEESPCFYFTQVGDRVKDKACDSHKRGECIINYANQGGGKSNTVTKDYIHTEFICGSLDPAPSYALMIIDANQPDPMCIGDKARYVCNSGGVNVRSDLTTMDTFAVTCNDNQEFDYPPPNDWPVCVDRLDCPAPPLEGLPEFDHDYADQTTPEFSIEYTCKFPNKQMITRVDLDQGKDSDLRDSLTVNCQLDGTYDINIEDWTCTKPCPHPLELDFEIMNHTWHFEEKLEIYQEVTYACLNGRHLVSKSAFATGEETNLLDEIMSLCQVTGWLNETIGSYTCTQACQPPMNYSEVFTNDWDESVGSDIGIEVKYICNNPIKKIVNLEEEESPSYDHLTVTCLYNGQYDTDVTKFGCTECLKRSDPPNGKYICDSKRYEAGSACILSCNTGYIPIGETQMICEMDEDTGDFVWNKEPELFSCVEPLAFIIGGQSDSLNYLNEVEVLAPGFDCSAQEISPYPLSIIGASAGYISGKSIVCGGAFQDYVKCKANSEFSQVCDRNAECVETLGGTLWCTGPKTKECYTYDPLLKKDWIFATNLKTSRVYQASTVSGDGTLWLIGGIGTSSILKSTEKVVYSGKKWKVSRGPNLPHGITGGCAAPLNSREIILLGGFSTDIFDYNDKALILNTDTNKWYPKQWAVLKNGPRFDLSCASVNWKDEKYVIIAGGWNNSATTTSELIRSKTSQFMKISEMVGESEIQALNVKIRSSTMAELNQIPTMAGGVICTGGSSERQKCKRTDKVFGLIQPSDSNEFGTNSKWTELPGVALSKPKSSHTLLIAPTNFAPQCYKN